MTNDNIFILSILCSIIIFFIAISFFIVIPDQQARETQQKELCLHEQYYWSHAESCIYYGVKPPQ